MPLDKRQLLKPEPSTLPSAAWSESGSSQAQQTGTLPGPVFVGLKLGPWRVISWMWTRKVTGSNFHGVTPQGLHDEDHRVPGHHTARMVLTTQVVQSKSPAASKLAVQQPPRIPPRCTPGSPGTGVPGTAYRPPQRESSGEPVAGHQERLTPGWSTGAS